MKLTQQQTQVIIDNGKEKGLSTKSIIDSLVKNGYEPEGVNVEAIKQTFAQPSPSTQPIPETQKVSSYDVAMGKTNPDGTPNTNKGIIPQSIDQFKEGFKQVKEGVSTGNIQQVGRGALNEAAGGLRAVFSPIEAATKIVAQVPGIHEVLGGVENAVNFVGDKIGDSKKLQQFMQDNPNADEVFSNALAVALSVTGAKKAPEIRTAINDTIDMVTSKSSKIPPTTPPPGATPKTGPMIQEGSMASNVVNKATSLKKDLQLKVAKKNVNPQLGSSAERLKSPIESYDNYYEKAKKSVIDIKTDKPIADIGTNIGNAFESVVKERSNVGKILGDELKANGSIKLNISEPKTNLFTELKNSGLSYNPKTNKLTSFQGTKFVPEEIAMLQEFVDGVNKLGTTPTVKQIDNFLTQTRTNLKFTKGKTGVIGTTNAERIINGGVAKLKETLNPKVNGNKSLSKYWEANKKYSDLSDFVEEGTPLLGKKTSSGDYAKDVGVAKSSVTSILNQGKKDFLTKLENLTGYQALDDTVLALQAMSDAGIAEGTTLLKAISEGSVPVSKLGWFSKVLNYGLDKAGNALVGDANQQTKAFLQSLSDKPKTKNPIAPKATTKAKTGATKSKTNQTKK